jgi:catechol 2,3-dioxygenase-like lactoylglutathione lyase family enzyme
VTGDERVRNLQSTGGVVAYGGAMNILFIAGFAVVAPDPPKSRELYIEALGLPLAAGEDGEYWHSEEIEGAKHFGVWPLSQAAEACFGTPSWPAELTVPQASIEFEVEDADAVAAGCEELGSAGSELLHPPRREPWGQTVGRLLSSEGLIVGVSYAPWLHEGAGPSPTG